MPAPPAQSTRRFASATSAMRIWPSSVSGFGSTRGYSTSSPLSTPYGDLCRVSFVMAGPGVPWEARTMAPSSHLDLMPTLLELAGVDGEGAALDEQEILHFSEFAVVLPLFVIGLEPPRVEAPGRRGHGGVDQPREGRRRKSGAAGRRSGGLRGLRKLPNVVFNPAPVRVGGGAMRRHRMWRRNGRTQTVKGFAGRCGSELRPRSKPGVLRGWNSLIRDIRAPALRGLPGAVVAQQVLGRHSGLSARPADRRKVLVLDRELADASSGDQRRDERQSGAQGYKGGGVRISHGVLTGASRRRA